MLIHRRACWPSLFGPANFLTRLAINWQQKMRRKGAVMKNRLSSDARLRRLSHWRAGIQIAIEAREVAAGDFEPDPVPALEQIAGRDQIDRELIRPAGFHQTAATRCVAIARPDNTFAEIGRIAVGSNVEQPRSEIGVGRGTRREENQF